MKTIVCPYCDSPKVKETRIKELRAGKIRQCLSCHYESVWFLESSMMSCDYDHMNAEWHTWECVYLDGSASLGNKLLARKLFKQNEVSNDS